MGKGNGINKGAPSLPGGNEYTSLQEECRAEPPGDTYAKAYRAKVYRSQAFLVSVASGPNRLLDWYPWESKDLKELW